MTVKLICVGRLKEKFYGDACAEFKKRISRFADVNIIEVSDERAPEQLSKAEMDQVKRAEGERILAKVAPGDYLIAMDLKGEQLTSTEMASGHNEFRRQQDRLRHRRLSGPVLRGASKGRPQALLRQAHLLPPDIPDNAPGADLPLLQDHKQRALS